MRPRALIGMTSSVFLAAGGFAHALLGWPAMRENLLSTSIDPGVIGALAAGWLFGSLAMLAFGTIVLHAAIQIRRGRTVNLFPSRAIAVAYIVFGVTAFVYRDFNPHFLFFVFAGALVALFAFRPPGIGSDPD